MTPRVALLAPYWPPLAHGGGEHSTVALARALGDAATLFCPQRVLAPAPCRVERLWDGPRHPSGHFRTRVPWLMALPWAAQLRARLPGHAVIHVQSKILLPAAWLAARATGIPLLVTVRDLGYLDAAPLCLHAADAIPRDCGVRKAWRECARQAAGDYGTPRWKFVAGFLAAKPMRWLLERADGLHYLSASHRSIIERELRKCPPAWTIPTLA